jgi:transketolase
MMIGRSASGSLEAAELGRRVRRIVIEQSRRAGVGHIGSAMSISDIIGVLFASVLRGAPDDPDRDRFILSKGHAALALYAALAETGVIDDATLNDFSTDGTPLGAHPEHLVPGIDFSTGSLGQGPTIAGGAALAARMQGSQRRVYALISDAELNEGSVWEAVMFAAHHRLGRLTLVIDLNGQQAFGYTKDVLALDDVAARFSVFGWDVSEVDGHDHAQLHEILDADRAADARPHAVIARTTFGKGVSFMESRIEWHYLPLSDEQFAAAMVELDRETGTG